MREKAGRRSAAIAAFACVLLLLPAFAFSQSTAALPNTGFAAVREILDKNCSSCHDWTGSRADVVGNGKVVPSEPDKSPLYTMIASDAMPMSGDPLTADQKALIRDWIAAGAADSSGAADSPGPADSSGAAQPGSSSRFLFFPSKVAFHATTGFTSTALLMGAGIIGVVHFIDMMNQGHIYRDAIGFTENDPNSVRAPWVIQAWKDDDSLRWWHVGLLVSGEALYLGDAATGLSMLTSPTPGRLTKQDVHRYAFYTHAALMAAQIVMGFFTTDALSRGDHDTVIALGAAHAAIGITIPLVMLGAGLENILLP